MNYYDFLNQFVKENGFELADKAIKNGELHKKLTNQYAIIKGKDYGELTPHTMTNYKNETQEEKRKRQENMSPDERVADDKNNANKNA